VSLYQFMEHTWETLIWWLSLSKWTCAGITEVLDQKGLREVMNRQDTYQEGQKADDQLPKFYFSQQALYKRGRDLNIKTVWPSLTFLFFAILYFYCQCPWLSTNFFSVKGNHLAFPPTMIEAWCTCRFRPCQNAVSLWQSLLFLLSLLFCVF
jgi:hypothetical protein